MMVVSIHLPDKRMLMIKDISGNWVWGLIQPPNWDEDGLQEGWLLAQIRWVALIEAADQNQQMSKTGKQFNMLEIKRTMGICSTLHVIKYITYTGVIYIVRLNYKYMSMDNTIIWYILNLNAIIYLSLMPCLNWW